MTDPNLIAKAKEIALAHHLPPELVCAICEQESDWEPWAIRYEDGFYTHYLDHDGSKRTSTEFRAQAFSWGLMQTMGAVARELGFHGKMASLCDPAIGIEYGCRKLEECLSRANQDLRAALQKYNGGGNPDYAEQVMARMGRYQ